MNLHENADANTVTATSELPGLFKEDIQIHVHNGHLHISGESQNYFDHEEGILYVSGGMASSPELYSFPVA